MDCISIKVSVSEPNAEYKITRVNGKEEGDNYFVGDVDHMTDSMFERNWTLKTESGKTC